MTQTPDACPGCGTTMAIHEDHASSVGEALAGFYVSHPFWVDYPVATKCSGYLAARLLPNTPDATSCIDQWNAMAAAMRNQGDVVVASLKVARDLHSISQDHPTHRFVIKGRERERALATIQETAGIMASYARMADDRSITFDVSIGTTEGAEMTDLPEGLQGGGGTSLGDAMSILFRDGLKAGPLDFENVAVLFRDGPKAAPKISDLDVLAAETRALGLSDRYTTASDGMGGGGGCMRDYCTGLV